MTVCVPLIFLRGMSSLSLSLPLSLPLSRTHSLTHTHARTHARTHTHTPHSLLCLVGAVAHLGYFALSVL
jgi:hypothetical protein